MMMSYLHGKGRMLIVCHLSYQDCEAIVYMNQNSINHTEQHYNYHATETLIIDNEMSNCCNSLISSLSSTKLPSPKLPSCVNFH